MGGLWVLFFLFLLKNIDCGYSLELPQRGSSNEYPQSMFLSRNKKNNVYPCKPQFYCIKVGFKGVKIIKVCFRDVFTCCAFSAFVSINANVSAPCFSPSYIMM